MSESTSAMKKRFKYRIQVEPRLEVPPGWFPLAVSLGALVVALILGASRPRRSAGAQSHACALYHLMGPTTPLPRAPGPSPVGGRR